MNWRQWRSQNEKTLQRRANHEQVASSFRQSVKLRKMSHTPTKWGANFFTLSQTRKLKSVQVNIFRVVCNDSHAAGGCLKDLNSG